MFNRPTTLAAAFVNAALKMEKAGKVDHQRGSGNWVARRTLINADKPGFAIIREFDSQPVKR